MSLTTQQIADLINSNGYEDRDAMNADKRTRRKIAIGDLTGSILYPSGLVLSNGSGSLADAVGNDSLPQDLRDGLSGLLAAISDSHIQNLDTTNAKIATQTDAVLAGAVAASLIDGEQVEAIYALGGGRIIPVDGISEGDWDDAVALNTLNDAKKDRVNEWQGWFNAALSPLQEQYDDAIDDINQAEDIESLPDVPEESSSS